jgi:tight adherence protein B
MAGSGEAWTSSIRMNGGCGMLNLIVVLVFISSLMLMYSVLKYFFIKQSSISRLRKYTNVEEIHNEKRKNVRRDFKSGLSFMARGIAGARFLDGYKKSVQIKLVRGHIMLKPEEFITINLICMAVAGLIGFAMLGSVMTAVIMAVIGWMLPSIVLKSKIRKRIKFLNEQLGDSIMLISNSLKAGYSFFQAIDIVAREMTGPIAEEFSLLQKEINLGVNTEKALENMVERVQSDDMELLVTAVLIQRQVGGNLAEVLDNITSTIRDRVKIKGEVRTVTAQGRISGLIIALLPVILCILLMLINREYMITLFTNPIGIGIIIFSAFMELIGIYLINKIVKVEV